MFSIDNFIEIQVVGFLLLLALSPVINLLAKDLRAEEGFCPFFETINDKSAKAILLLVLAFSVGIAGNRLVDEVFDYLGIEGREEFETKCSKPASDTDQAEYEKCLTAQQNSTKAFDKWVKEHPDKLKKIKLAEYYVSDNSETAKEYFERHKSFMRVLRGAAFASLFLLFSMMIYQNIRKNKRLSDACDRYNRAHFLIVTTFFVMFSAAYYFESCHYYNRVVSMYTEGFFDQKRPEGYK